MVARFNRWTNVWGTDQSRGRRLEPFKRVSIADNIEIIDAATMSGRLLTEWARSKRKKIKRNAAADWRCRDRRPIRFFFCINNAIEIG